MMAVASAPDGAGRRVTLTLNGAPGANRMFVVIPKSADLARIDSGGHSYTPDKDSLNPIGNIFGCLTDDCRTRSVTLSFASKTPVEVWIGEQHYGLPPDGAKLLQARPATASAIHAGDTTIVFGKLKL